MAYSDLTYSAVGGVKDFAVTFDYLDASHVYVSVDNVITTEAGSNYTAELIGSTTMRVSTAVNGDPPPAGTKVRIFRNTPIDQPAVVFGAGASLSSENLNKNSEYLTYALQEATDDNEAFTTRYLGAFTDPPTTDNGGGALIVGALYWASTDESLNFWNGTEWKKGDLLESSIAAKNAAEAAEEASLEHKGDAAASASTSVTKAGEASTSADEAAASAASINPESIAITGGTIDGTVIGGSTPVAISGTTGAFTSLTLGGVPVIAELASQAQAEAGTDNTRLMTPLRTAEAIEELAPELTQAQATDDTSTVFGTASGQRLRQSVESAVLDEDDFASNSATRPPSQQSTKAYVDTNTVGVGQTWQDVLSSRTPGTIYQNTTGKPIMVAVRGAGGGESIQVSEDGVTFVTVGYNGVSSGWEDSCSFIVPNNHYYRCNGGGRGTWAELR